MNLNEMNSFVSVIVPIYNVELFLRKCIDSILNQTYKYIEIILVNDGSTDCSGKICDEYKYIDDRIIVIHKSNGGLSSARNAGIDIATGDYLFFVDSDDYLPYDSIEILLKTIKKYNAKISSGCFTIVDNNECFNYIKSLNDCDEKLIDNISYQCNMIYRHKYCLSDSACGKLYDRFLFSDVRFPVGKIDEDTRTIYKIVDKVENIAETNSNVYFYYQRNNSIMHDVNNNINFEHLCALMEIEKYFADKESQHYKHIFEYINIQKFIRAYTVLKSISKNNVIYNDICKVIDDNSLIIILSRITSIKLKIIAIFIYKKERMFNFIYRKIIK